MPFSERAGFELIDDFKFFFGSPIRKGQQDWAVFVDFLKQFTVIELTCSLHRAVFHEGLPVSVLFARIVHTYRLGPAVGVVDFAHAVKDAVTVIDFRKRRSKFIPRLPGAVAFTVHVRTFL